VGRYLRPGMLVVLESTVTPGTTAGFAREILEKESGLTAGTDFALAHAPERVMVGRLLRNLREHDRIVGGIDEASTLRATELYSPILTTGKVIPMSATAAEVTKTTENTFRDLQIAAMNELALYCEAMGINVYDVRTGVDSLKGEGITRAMLWPGGCWRALPDKRYLSSRTGCAGPGKGSSRLPGRRTFALGAARHVNDFMPVHMLNLNPPGTKRVGKQLSGARIALLGWAFIAKTPMTPATRHRNHSESRQSPQEQGLLCTIPGSGLSRGVEIEHDLSRVLSQADAVVIFTGHSQYRSLDSAHGQKSSAKLPVR